MNIWKVKEYYEGVFETERTLCICSDIEIAAMIIDAMCLLHAGRPFHYQIKYMGTNWETDKEELVFTNPITDETTDYTEYVTKGKSTL